MKAIIIGLGSMGRRRIRLIKQLFYNIEIIGVDLNDDRCFNVGKEYNIKTYNNIDNINCGKGDVAFVCTSPATHGKITLACLNKKLHVFSELNLLYYWYNDAIELANKNSVTLFLSSTFLYRKEIEFIKNKVRNNNNLLNYTYHVGQYLPDWHPWESYKDFFVSKKETNGCRELLAIELPWILDVFGDIKSYKILKNKISSLDIDFNDTYMILINHISGHSGIISVDVVSRKAVRNLEVYGEDVYLTWHGNPDSLYEFNLLQKKDVKINLYDSVNHIDSYGHFIIENAYMEEIKEFFDVIKGIKYPKYDYIKDMSILKIIDDLERC